MIRILHVIGKMGCGGAETMLMNLYRNTDRNKVQFDFVVHTDKRQFYDDEIESLGGRIYRTEKFNVLNFFSYQKFWDQFLSEHPEYQIVHGHINSSAAIYLRCAKKHGRTAVVHSHATQNYEISARAVAFRFFSYPIRYIADWFFACSMQAGKDRFGEKVVESERFRVLYNGIDTCKFSYNPVTRCFLREKYHISEHQIIVGHVGRFTQAKNHKYLIQVFKEIQKRESNAQLWLIGEGELESQIKKQINDMGIRENVCFYGVTNCVHDFLQAMDVFLFPSLYEGLGMALIEAQTTGLPCIVSEAIQGEADIGAGLIFPMHLEDNPESWADIALKAAGQTRKDAKDYAVSAGYDILESAKILQTFYEDLVTK